MLPGGPQPLGESSLHAEAQGGHREDGGNRLIADRCQAQRQPDHRSRHQPRRRRSASVEDHGHDEHQEAPVHRIVEVRRLPFVFGNFQSLEEIRPQRPRAEREGQLEHRRKRRFDLFQLGLGEAFVQQGFPVDHRRIVQRQRAHDELEDVVDLLRHVAEIDQRGAQRLVGDLEISAAGEFFEFDECEIRLDAGGVAVHQQADRAGGGDDGGLGVSIAVPLAEE